MTAAQIPGRSEHRRRRLLAAFVALAGILGASILWWAAGVRYDRAVEGLARAPIGCDTTLDFTKTGTFVFFAESRGGFDPLDGNCGATGEFEVEPDASPTVRLELLDPGGEVVDLEQPPELDYDRAGYAGSAVRQAEIDSVGSYTLRASSSDGTFAVAVGRDPERGVALLRTLAIVALAVGVVSAVLLLIVARRRPHSQPSLATSAPGDSDWSAPAPTGPPMAAPPPPGRAPSEAPAPDGTDRPPWPIGPPTSPAGSEPPPGGSPFAPPRAPEPVSGPVSPAFAPPPTPQAGSAGPAVTTESAESADVTAADGDVTDPDGTTRPRSPWAPPTAD